MYSFSYLEPFHAPCSVLTVPSWPAYRFLKRQVRWSGISISFRICPIIVIPTVKGFGIVNKAEIDVFQECSCFFDDPADFDNLIPGSSAFSKTSLNIWKFTVHNCSAGVSILIWKSGEQSLWFLHHWIRRIRNLKDLFHMHVFSSLEGWWEASE